jgi:hypothetical protein
MDIGCLTLSMLFRLNHVLMNKVNPTVFTALTLPGSLMRIERLLIDCGDVLSNLVFQNFETGRLLPEIQH